MSLFEPNPHILRFIRIRHIKFDIDIKHAVR